jgi:hypothetical protein
MNDLTITVIKLSEVKEEELFKIRKIFEMAGFESKMNKKGAVLLIDQKAKDIDKYADALQFRNILEAARAINSYLMKIHFEIVA